MASLSNMCKIDFFHFSGNSLRRVHVFLRRLEIISHHHFEPKMRFRFFFLDDKVQTKAVYFNYIYYFSKATTLRVGNSLKKTGISRLMNNCENLQKKVRSR